VRSRNARRGVGLGPKSETELLWLSFGRAVWNGNGEHCIGVGWWSVRGSGGGRVVCSRNGRQGAAFGPKSETELLWLGFGCAV
jgi:hypothetical protein